MQHHHHQPDLGRLTVTSFLDGFEFRDRIMQKLNDLDPANPAHQRLEGAARILLDMIEESKQRRYTGMPLILLGEALIELDRFVQIRDKNPDTWIDGYRDDHSRMMALCEQYQHEINAFLEWRKSRHDDYVRRAPATLDLTAYPASR